MYCEVHHEGIEERAQAPQIRRLFAEWQQLRQRHGHVPFAPFDPIGRGALADDMIVLVPIDDDTCVYAHYGAGIIAHMGMDLTGLTTAELKGEVGDFFRAVNARALEEGRALFTLHRAAYSARVHMWERLVLPCRDTDGSPVLVIYNKPRELKDDLLRAILDASLDGILAVRLRRGADHEPVDGEIILANRRAAQLSGRSIEEMMQTSLLTLFPSLKEGEAWGRLAGVALTREPAEFLAPYPGRDGRKRWFEIAAAPLGDGFMATYADVTEKKRIEDEAELQRLEFAAANAALQAEIARRQKLEQELSRLATVDALTGALNRRAITEGLQRALSLSERYGHPVSLFALDLDHFKRINDTYGHAAGDEVLRHTVRLLTHGLREDVDLVGRLGGEEFVAVLPHTGREDAAAVAERIRAALAARTVAVDGRPLRCTGSFGVAAWDGRETPDRLLSRADAALYQAKAAGRDMVVVSEGSSFHIVSHDGASPDGTDPEIIPFQPRTRRGTAPRRRPPSP